jgi:hypothetical protein
MICLAAAALVAAMLLPLCRADGAGVSWTNYCRIQPGMTRAEVEQLLGVPPGGYCAERTRLASDPPLAPELEGGELWVTDNGGIVVAFDDSGRAIAKGWLKPLDRTKWSPQRLVWRVREWWKELRE